MIKRNQSLNKSAISVSQKIEILEALVVFLHYAPARKCIYLSIVFGHCNVHIDGKKLFI